MTRSRNGVHGWIKKHFIATVLVGFFLMWQLDLVLDVGGVGGILGYPWKTVAEDLHDISLGMQRYYDERHAYPTLDDLARGGKRWLKDEITVQGQGAAAMADADYDGYRLQVMKIAGMEGFCVEARPRIKGITGWYVHSLVVHRTSQPFSWHTNDLRYRQGCDAAPGVPRETR